MTLLPSSHHMTDFTHWLAHLSTTTEGVVFLGSQLIWFVSLFFVAKTKKAIMNKTASWHVFPNWLLLVFFLIVMLITLALEFAFGRIVESITLFFYVFFFVLSIQKTMSAVPRNKHLLQMWLMWFMLSPVVACILRDVLYLINIIPGFEFYSIEPIIMTILGVTWFVMLPFVIPKTLSRHPSSNHQPTKKIINTLLILGIFNLISSGYCHLRFFMPTFKVFINFGEPSLMRFLAIALIFAPPIIITVYWVKLLTIRQHFYTTDNHKQCPTD